MGQLKDPDPDGSPPLESSKFWLEGSQSVKLSNWNWVAVTTQELRFDLLHNCENGEVANVGRAYSRGELSIPKRDSKAVTLHVNLGEDFSAHLVEKAYVTCLSEGAPSVVDLMVSGSIRGFYGIFKFDHEESLKIHRPIL